MMQRFAFVALLTLSCSLGCQSHSYTQRGAATGGLGGAGLGAIIGEITADEPLAGAAIGSAVGALTGATVGSGLDEIESMNRSRYASQAAYNQPIGTTLNEVISMSNAGLSDQIISRHIRNEGFARSLDAGDLIALRQQGVSDGVIADLQDVSSQPAVRVASAQSVIDTPSVIVEERYHAVPVPYGPPPRRYRRAPFCPPPCGPGLHWGVAFGH